MSKWTHDLLPQRKPGRVKSAVGIEYTDRFEFTLSKMPGQMRDWTVECVCRDCNNGWMREIENLAKPIMTPLILGKPGRIWPRDQQIIATWAVLKAMVANHQTVERADLDYMYQHHLPPPDRWAVWIGHYERGAWKPEWLSRHFAVLPDAQYSQNPGAEVAFSNSAATTLVLGRLFTHVVHSPLDSFPRSWSFRRRDGSPARGLMRIWPAANHASVLWPTWTLTDRDADEAADAVIDGVKRVAAILRAQRAA
jgi:hypothetical protein